MQETSTTDRPGTTQLNPDETGSQPVPTPQQWIAIRPLVEQLYVIEDLPLEVVKVELERRHGFRASERMYKDRLKRWGYHKNLKREDWLALAILDQRYEALGKKPDFIVHRKRKTRKDLNKYIRSLDMTKKEFLASGVVEIPDYIRCATDQVDASKSSPSDSSSNGISPQSPLPSDPQSFAIPAPLNMTRELPSIPVFCSPHDSLSSPISRNSPPSETRSPFGRTSTTMTHSTEATSIHETMEVETKTSTCDVLEYEVQALCHQIVDPSPLQTTYGINDFQSWTIVEPSDDFEGFRLRCSKCFQPWTWHSKSLDSLIPEHLHPSRQLLNDAEEHAWVIPTSTKEEGAWTWVACCFAAFIQCRQSSEWADMALKRASDEFEKLLKRQDKMLLTAAGQMAAILHQHNQGEEATKILESALAVVIRLLAPDHPIRVTIAFFTYSMGLQLNNSGINSSTMRTAFEQLLRQYGPWHPYSIAAHHNFAWMLKYERSYPEAEDHFRQVYSYSYSVFGRHHMQSLTSLGCLGSAQTAQGKWSEGIRNIKQVLQDGIPTLGARHPYLLDGKRRLARLYQKCEEFECAKRLRREILEGSIEMLGKKHCFTQGDRMEYEKSLKDVGQWTDESRDELEALFRDSSTTRSRSASETSEASEASDQCKAF